MAKAKRMKQKDRKLQKVEIVYSIHGGWLVIATDVGPGGGSSSFPLWGEDDKVLFESYEKALEVAGRVHAILDLSK